MKLKRPAKPQSRKEIRVNGRKPNTSNYRGGVLKYLIYIATILWCRASKNDGKAVLAKYF